MNTRFSRLLTTSTGALAMLPVLAQRAYADASGLPYQGQHWSWDWGGGHMLFGSLTMLLFWGGLIALVVLAVRWLGGGSGEATAATSRKSALEVLRERFARGDIEKDEFEDRKQLLSE